jgi:predicted component of viral defense system (DUF524 family)
MVAVMVLIVMLFSNRLLARNIDREVLDSEANFLTTAVLALLRTEAEDTETNTDARTHLLETELVNLVALVEEFDTLGALADNDEEVAIAIRSTFAPSLDGLATNNNTTLAICSASLPFGGFEHFNPLGVSG